MKQSPFIYWMVQRSAADRDALGEFVDEGVYD